MTDRKTRRLALLSRLREMNVEQARAEHVAAQAELDKRRESADDTQRRLEAIDQWSLELISRGTPLAPELLRQAALFRGAEQGVLKQQRSAEAEQGELTEAARGVLTHRFEELSVVERLAERHSQAMTHEELRRGYVDLDEAGAQRMNLETKE